MDTHTLICLLPKSPVPRRGRIGPVHFQDWYRSCVLATQLAKELKGTVLVPTAFTSMGESEADVYLSALRELGADVQIVRRGFETVEQLDVAVEAAERKSLIIVSTFLHFPRVWWLTRGKKNVSHRVVYGGLPRPKGVIADLILIIIFPVIDLLGWRKNFLSFLEQRRKRGQL